MRLPFEVITVYPTIGCQSFCGSNSEESRGRRHTLDAVMPRHLTPCRLWQSSLGRCGFPATPRLESTAGKNLFIRRKLNKMLRLRSIIRGTAAERQPAEFAAPYLKLTAFPRSKRTSFGS